MHTPGSRTCLGCLFDDLPGEERFMTRLELIMMFIECRYHGRRIYRQHVRLVQYDNFSRGGGESIFTGVTFEAARGEQEERSGGPP